MLNNNKRKGGSPVPGSTAKKQNVHSQPQPTSSNATTNSNVQSAETSAQIEPIVSCLNNMSKTICEKLDKIIHLMENTNVQRQIPTNIIETTVNDITIGQSSIVSKLAELKSARNDSYFKLIMNEKRAEVYNEGLAANPQRVPRKLHEAINRSDNPNINELKKDMTIKRVESEIQKLTIHKTIHENKVKKLEEQAKSMISNLEDAVYQTTMKEKWDNMISLASQATVNKWSQRANFLRSEHHMVVLGEGGQTHYNNHFPRLPPGPSQKPTQSSLSKNWQGPHRPTTRNKTSRF